MKLFSTLNLGVKTAVKSFLPQGENSQIEAEVDLK